MLIELFILVVLSAMAYQDYTTRMVDDYLIIILWFLCLFHGNLFILVLSFCSLWLWNTITKVRMGWADILGIPPFIALINYNILHLYALLSTLGLLVAYYITQRNKEMNCALYPFAWYFYINYLIFYILLGNLFGIV